MNFTLMESSFLSPLTKLENLNEKTTFQLTYLASKQYSSQSTSQKNALTPMLICMLYSQGTTNHYCLNKYLNKLLYDQNRHKARMLYCIIAFMDSSEKSFYETTNLIAVSMVYNASNSRTKRTPRFSSKDHHKQLKVTFVINAEFESLTTKIDSTQPNSEKSSTEKYQHHQPSGFPYVVVSELEQYSKPPVVYRGEDVVDKFLERLEIEQQYIQEKLDFIEPMRIDNEENQMFQDATKCHICGFELGSDCVRDHCHLTGKFRVARIMSVT